MISTQTASCCCFTGHRPDKLSLPTEQILRGLGQEVDRAIQSGCTTFLTGMAHGVDLLAAQIVLERRCQDPRVKLVCVVPFPGMQKNWRAEWRILFDTVLGHADFVKTIAPAYHRGVYQMRNEWMVEHSCLVIAVFNGSPGGTKDTLDYARRRGVAVRILPG